MFVGKESAKKKCFVMCVCVSSWEVTGDYRDQSLSAGVVNVRYVEMHGKEGSMLCGVLGFFGGEGGLGSVYVYFQRKTYGLHC